MRRDRFIVAFGLLLTLVGRSHCQSTAPQTPTDWDLYMLKLVNAARTDPVGENARRGTNYVHPAVPPLAYDLSLGRAAQNHTEWMAANANNPAIYDPTNTTSAPDSFTHYETLNAQRGGPAAVGTPGFTGAGIGERISYTGFNWNRAAENAYWRSSTPAITAALIESNHVGWWNSEGHRNSVMSGLYTAMGHHVLVDQDTWATQEFATPAGATQTHLFGVLYTDKNASGSWEPRNSTDVNREGLGNVAYRVYHAGTATPVGSESFTFDNGGFSFRIGSGTYDLQFLLGEGNFWVRGISLAGQNVDLGDLVTAASASSIGDYNGNGIVDAADYVVWRDTVGETGGALPADGNRDGVVDADDYGVWRRHFGKVVPGPGGASTLASTSTVPEPATLRLISAAAMALVLAHGAGSRRPRPPALMSFLRPRFQPRVGPDTVHSARHVSSRRKWSKVAAKNSKPPGWPNRT
jgi:uncharacterized protein YkwD